MAKAAQSSEHLMYKDKPLMRSGNKIYYGNPNDCYIILFTVTSSHKVEDMDVADKVTIELMTNSGREKEKVYKKAVRPGLFEALDIAEFWLRDALANG
ncbi:MAG: hypothetical protein LUG52_06995 [Clostridia bacterium]|nr:hypothetical protein [Clostridia bacterium]